jgi:hypothetical protein
MRNNKLVPKVKKINAIWRTCAALAFPSLDLDEGEFEEIIMVEVLIEEIYGSD